MQAIFVPACIGSPPGLPTNVRESPNKMNTRAIRLPLLLCALCIFTSNATAGEAPFNVLVVMSYERDNPWCQEIREGIEGVLAEHAELDYVYMNTKDDPAGGPAKARQAFSTNMASRWCTATSSMPSPSCTGAP